MLLVPAPEAGRVFRHAARVGLGDVSPAGRARFDAIARWLHDAAYADWVDAELDDATAGEMVATLALGDGAA